MGIGGGDEASFPGGVGIGGGASYVVGERGIWSEIEGGMYDNRPPLPPEEREFSRSRPEPEFKGLSMDVEAR